MLRTNHNRYNRNKNETKKQNEKIEKASFSNRIKKSFRELYATIALQYTNKTKTAIIPIRLSVETTIKKRIFKSHQIK